MSLRRRISQLSFVISVGRLLIGLDVSQKLTISRQPGLVTRPVAAEWKPAIKINQQRDHSAAGSARISTECYTAVGLWAVGLWGFGLWGCADVPKYDSPV